MVRREAKSNLLAETAAKRGVDRVCLSEEFRVTPTNLTSVAVLTSAPARSKRFTVSRWPLQTAAWRGVLPSLFLGFSWGDLPNNRRTTRRWFLSAARCRGV